MAYSEAGHWQNWSSGLCLALWSVGDWQDGTFQLQVGGRATSHRLSCLTLPVSTWLTSLSRRVWSGIRLALGVSGESFCALPVVSLWASTFVGDILHPQGL